MVRWRILVNTAVAVLTAAATGAIASPASADVGANVVGGSRAAQGEFPWMDAGNLALGADDLQIRRHKTIRGGHRQHRRLRALDAAPFGIRDLSLKKRLHVFLDEVPPRVLHGAGVVDGRVDAELHRQA